MKKLFFLLAIIFLSVNYSLAQREAEKVLTKQFIYLLRLEKSMLDSASWTAERVKLVEDHFERLKKMKADGSLILAGRTQTPPEKTFGIVIYEAGSLEKAREIAESDPAVVGKIMTVEVFPYEVALMRGVN